VPVTAQPGPARVLFVVVVTLTLGAGAVMAPAPSVRAQDPEEVGPPEEVEPSLLPTGEEGETPGGGDEGLPEYSAVPPGVPAPPVVSAASAILIDWRTGQVLYAKDAYLPRAPASTTKILTAIVVLENADLSEKVVVSRNAASTPGSAMQLRAGQVLTVGELLWGVLLRSGNNACVALAEHIAGTEEAFVEMLNRRARELGARSTHFRNSHGISVPHHYSTAFDLALMARYAMTIPAFEAIVRTREATLPLDGGEWALRMRNTNSLLWTFAGADGVKTGTTAVAGRCLVASATRGGRRLLSVVLRSDDRYRDSAELLEWGFANFTTVCLARAEQAVGAVPVRRGLERSVTLVTAEDFWAACPAWAGDALGLDVHIYGQVKAPVRRGQVLGVAEATLDEGVVRAVNLVAERDVLLWTPERAALRALLSILKLLARFGVG